MTMNQNSENMINREQLLESFQLLQSKFDNSLAKAREKEKSFEQMREFFTQRLFTHLQNARNGLPNENPLKQQISGFINLMEKTQREWDSKIAGREKGVKFREGFEDSLLVFINGKVKSGKSSLGNYMAWGHTDPDDALKANTTPSLAPAYFSHERNNVAGGDTDHEAQEKREFRVGATEATSSIQGFKLPGLTWVDSPGLHSVKKENEALARDYVEHADLIIYTMKSDSPGRDSDLQEVKLLLGRGKKIIVLLTGSDDIEEDCDDEMDSIVQKVVMKDPQRCEKQQAYVLEALGKLADSIDEKRQMAAIDIVSISARYAQLNTNDPAALAESGIASLCATLHRIAQSEGVLIKQKTPMTNMDNFLRSCHQDINPYQDLLTSFSRPLNELRQKSDRELGTHIRSAQFEIHTYIDNHLNKIEEQRRNKPLANKELSLFQDALVEEIQAIAEKSIYTIFNSLTHGFKEAVANVYSSSELVNLVKLPDFKIETVEEQMPIIRSGAKKRNSLFGSILGGVAGFLVGGPAGAVLGAGLGAGAGSATGRSDHVDYRKEVFTVGDNLQEIRHQAIQVSNLALESAITQAHQKLWDSINKDVGNLIEEISQETKEFQKNIHLLLNQQNQNHHG